MEQDGESNGSRLEPSKSLSLECSWGNLPGAVDTSVDVIAYELVRVCVTWEIVVKVAVVICVVVICCVIVDASCVEIIVDAGCVEIIVDAGCVVISVDAGCVVVIVEACCVLINVEIIVEAGRV